MPNSNWKASWFPCLSCLFPLKARNPIRYETGKHLHGLTMMDFDLSTFLSSPSFLWKDNETIDGSTDIFVITWLVLFLSKDHGVGALGNSLALLLFVKERGKERGLWSWTYIGSLNWSDFPYHSDWHSWLQKEESILIMTGEVLFSSWALLNLETHSPRTLLTLCPSDPDQCISCSGNWAVIHQQICWPLFILASLVKNSRKNI